MIWYNILAGLHAVNTTVCIKTHVIRPSKRQAQHKWRACNLSLAWSKYTARPSVRLMWCFSLVQSQSETVTGLFDSCPFTEVINQFFSTKHYQGNLMIDGYTKNCLENNEDTWQTAGYVTIWWSFHISFIYTDQILYLYNWCLLYVGHKVFSKGVIFLQNNSYNPWRWRCMMEELTAAIQWCVWSTSTEYLDGCTQTYSTLTFAEKDIVKSRCPWL